MKKQNPVYILLNTNREKNIPLVFSVKGLDDVKRKLMMVARQFEENIYRQKKVRISGKLLFKDKMYRFSGSKTNVKLTKTGKKEKQTTLLKFF